MARPEKKGVIFLQEKVQHPLTKGCYCYTLFGSARSSTLKLVIASRLGQVGILLAPETQNSTRRG